MLTNLTRVIATNKRTGSQFTDYRFARYLDLVS